jgi:hypothetical protein
MNSAILGLLSVSGDDPAGSKWAVPAVVDDVDEDDVPALVAASRADMVEAARELEDELEEVRFVVDAVEFAELWVVPAESAESVCEAAVSNELSAARNDLIGSEMLPDCALATVC